MRITVFQGSRDSVRIETEGGSPFFTRLVYLEGSGAPPEIVDALRAWHASADVRAGHASTAAPLAFDADADYDDDVPASGDSAAAIGTGETALPAWLETAKRAWEAETKAAELLSRSEQPRFALERKLAVRKFSRLEAKLALDFLEGDGLVDDARYANAWASSRMRRNARGPAEIEAGLRARGVSPDVAAAAVGAIFDAETRAAALEAAVAKARRKPSCDDSKLRAKLARQGYGRAELDRALGHERDT